MARGGINKAVVQKARNALLARGLHPSIDAVRIELGNTGSKTTIHRYLKELEASEQAISSDALSAPLMNLIGQLLGQLKQEAQQSVSQGHEALARERSAVQNQSVVLETRMRDIESQRSNLALQLQASQELAQQEQLQRQAAEVDNVRMVQALQSLEVRLLERDEQIQSLQDMYQHAREGMEHYRQASKEQREQELRRHEAQISQLQSEIRQLQQTLMIKQDELTILNRDNARLLSEANQQQRGQRALQQQLNQMASELGTLQISYAESEQQRESLRTRCETMEHTLKRTRKVSRLNVEVKK